MATKKNLTTAAQAATNHLFTGMSEGSESAQEGRSPVKMNKPSAVSKKPEKAVPEAQGRRMTGKGKKIDDTKVFSFRGWKDEVDQWRLYAMAKGMKIDEVGSAAMNEYIKRHPVTAEESELQKALEKVRSRK